MIYVDTRDEIKRVMHSKKGFTIVELVVVVVVIGILAAITIVSYGAITNTAKNQAVSSEAQKVGADLKKYKSNVGEYPIGLGDIAQSDTYTYQYRSVNGSSYCLAVAQNKASYFVTSDNAEPQEGGCSPVLAAGLYHSAAIKNGKVYGWGRNNYGQVGNGGSADDRLTAVPVNVPGTPIAVSAGYYYSLALTSDGLVYGWGNGANGQIGNGSTASQFTPQPATTTGVLSGKKIVDVVAGGSHTLALSSDGKLYAWGRNANGQLGNGQTTDSLVPVAVDMSGALAGKQIVAVDAGYLHSMALASDGTVYTWGANNYGQLGNNSSVDSSRPVAVQTSGVLSGKRVRAIASGYYYSIVVTSDSKIYGWGMNAYGQLGNGLSANTPTPVATTMSGPLASATIDGIAAGGNATTVYINGGQAIYSWGYNLRSQLGNGGTSNSSLPVATTMTGALSGKRIQSLSMGDYHALTMDTDGAVYSWGYNVNGQLGSGSTNNELAPLLITIP